MSESLQAQRTRLINQLEALKTQRYAEAMGNDIPDPQFELDRLALEAEIERLSDLIEGGDDE